jgi:hypothetical protein
MLHLAPMNPNPNNPSSPSSSGAAGATLSGGLTHRPSSRAQPTINTNLGNNNNGIISSFNQNSNNNTASDPSTPLYSSSLPNDNKFGSSAYLTSTSPVVSAANSPSLSHHTANLPSNLSNLSDNPSDSANGAARSLTEPLLASNYLYYEGFDGIIEKIQKRREREKELAEAKQDYSTGQQLTVIGILLGLSVIVLTFVIVFLYPRIPTFSLMSVTVSEFDSSSYGQNCDSLSCGSIKMSYHFSVWNSNFMATAIDSIDVQLNWLQNNPGKLNSPLQNTQSLNNSNAVLIDSLSLGRYKLEGRSFNGLNYDFSIDFANEDFSTWMAMNSTLSANENQLQFSVLSSIVASETFRIRNMGFSCNLVVFIDNNPKRQSGKLLAAQCEQFEATT